jgi:hypothetical protein
MQIIRKDLAEFCGLMFWAARPNFYPNSPQMIPTKLDVMGLLIDIRTEERNDLFHYMFRTKNWTIDSDFVKCIIDTENVEQFENDICLIKMASNDLYKLFLKIVYHAGYNNSCNVMDISIRSKPMFGNGYIVETNSWYIMVFNDMQDR